MIRDSFLLKRYDWLCHIYYVVTKPNSDEILSHLHRIGCSGDNMITAYKNLKSGKLNTGLTYSNAFTRTSIVVISNTSSALEFLQSLTHELVHLSNDIAKCYGIDLDGEEVRYINDELIALSWGISRGLICGCFDGVSCKNLKI